MNIDFNLYKSNSDNIYIEYEEIIYENKRRLLSGGLVEFDNINNDYISSPNFISDLVVKCLCNNNLVSIEHATDSLRAIKGKVYTLKLTRSALLQII